MNRDKFLRTALRVTTLFNIAVAWLLAFRSAELAGPSDVPLEAPLVYRAMLSFFVLLFGLTYGWMAWQPVINRPLVALSAIGKSGAFAIIVAVWLRGELPDRIVALASGDLVFAAIFTWWLASTTGSRTA